MKTLTRTFTNIRRTPYQSFAAILVMTTTFIVGILISFTAIGIFQALSYFETSPQVIIFFKNDVGEEAINALEETIQTIPEVSNIEYVPQEEALGIYQQLSNNDPSLLELVSADILPASLEVSTDNLEALKNIAEIAQDAPGVDEVALPGGGNDVVDLLSKWLNGIKIAGGTLIALMVSSSIITIGIVVGTKIARKNYEIKVLRLIGASKWYIQGPFLAEGAIYGMVSSILAFLTVFTVVLYATPVILDFSGEVPLLPQNPLLIASIFGISLATGTLIGTIGSWIAVIRFLSRD